MVHESFVFSKKIHEISTIQHGFSTRLGGHSQGAYGTLNLGLHVDDDSATVEKNTDTALGVLDLNGRTLVRLKQVHGARVVKIDETSQGVEWAADACWSETSDLVLCVLVADCLPIVLSDQKGSFIAAVHAGWRGTAEKITVNMIQALKSAGKDVAEFRVALGPAIGPCCFEVDARVAQKLKTSTRAGIGLEKSAHGDKYQANLWHINKQQLLECGVPSQGIDVVRECTKCSKKYYSYRRDGGITGRQSGLIGFS